MFIVYRRVNSCELVRHDAVNTQNVVDVAWQLKGNHEIYGAGYIGDDEEANHAVGIRPGEAACERTSRLKPSKAEFIVVCHICRFAFQL